MVNNIHIGCGLVRRLDEFLPAGRRVITITDRNVYALCKNVIGEHIIIETGEENKTLKSIEAIHSQLIAMGADRATFIVGFGGGIVTDVAGFAAATFMRGVDCGFVATTLLAQVDASVGGKNGVNVGGYKNMAGTFRQPEMVICDVDLLDTLPPREFRAGLAEIIKAGVTGDAALFELVENHDIRKDKALLVSAIKASVAVKAAIVDADETEQGERRKLNLGHTFGHAIEKLTREFNHGEAVSIGMVMACRVGQKLGVTPPETAGRIERALARAALPTHTDLSLASLVETVRHDKKANGGEIDFVLADKIGGVEVRRLTPEELNYLA